MADVSGAYWKGADGNYYLRANNVDGVVNLGASPSQNQSFVTFANSGQYQQIADPNAPQPQQAAPTGGGGGGETRPVLNQAAVSNTQKSIDQILPMLQQALEANNIEYNNTVRDFGNQETAQKGQYDQSSTTNMQNYDANMMDSVRAGVRGLSNLMGLLRGTGVERQAEDIVSGQTSQDIREGLDTRTENQTTLDSTLSSFLTELQRKKQLAEDTRVNNERATNRDFKSQLQDLYGKMAGFYGDAGNTGEATNWMNRAGDLTPEIAANSARQVSAYDKAPITVKAPEITAFAAPKEQSIGYADNGQLGAGIFTLGDRRRREPAVAGA